MHNQTTTYKSDLMQRMLGRNYKWWYVVTYSFRQSNIKLTPFLVLNLGSVLDFVITLYLWVLIEPTSERISYFFVGFMIQRLIWSQYMMNFGAEITNGSINKRLLLPIDNFKFWFFREIGASVLRNSISSVLILLFIPFFVYLLQLPSLSFLVSIPFYLITAFVIDFCFSYILGSVAFWNNDYRPFGYLFTISIKLLSGIAIPFSYLPSTLSSILVMNPYAYITHHPMQIYLGKYDTNQILMVFAGGIAWCIILYFLAKLIFKLGLKKNEAVGL